MLLYILVGSLLPYIESLDSWLFQGTLDDPFDEVFPFPLFICILYELLTFRYFMYYFQ